MMPASFLKLRQPWPGDDQSARHCLANAWQEANEERNLKTDVKVSKERAQMRWNADFSLLDSLDSLLNSPSSGYLRNDFQISGMTLLALRSFRVCKLPGRAREGSLTTPSDQGSSEAAIG